MLLHLIVLQVLLEKPATNKLSILKLRMLNNILTEHYSVYYIKMYEYDKISTDMLVFFRATTVNKGIWYNTYVLD